MPLLNKCSLAVVLAALSVTAHAEEKEYTSFTPALIEAIDAPGGTIDGYLVGPAAAHIANTTGSTEPITLNISTFKEFKPNREGWI